MLQRTPLLVNRLDTVYAWSALLWRMVERIAALHVARVIRAIEKSRNSVEMTQMAPGRYSKDRGHIAHPAGPYSDV